MDLRSFISWSAKFIFFTAAFVAGSFVQNGWIVQLSAVICCALDIFEYIKLQEATQVLKKCAVEALEFENTTRKVDLMVHDLGFSDKCIHCVKNLQAISEFSSELELLKLHEKRVGNETPH